MKYSAHARIAGLGTYLPEKVVKNAELETTMGIPQGWIERVTGVLERRRAGTETTAQMAAAAVRDALNDAESDLDEVELIIGACTAPQQLIPCTAAFIQREMGAVEGRSACFDIGATCLSFLVALHTASLYIHLGHFKCVVIVSSEVTSLALNSQQPESAALFGDAAVAAVLKPCEGEESSGIGHWALSTFSSGAHLTELRGGGTFRHPNDPCTTPEDNMFHMDGPAVLRMALQTMPKFFKNFLEKAEAVPQDYNLIIPHQASFRGIDFMRRALGVEKERLFINLEHRGNCIAASIPLALAESKSTGRLKRGQRILLLGTGAGLTLGALELIF